MECFLDLHRLAVRIDGQWFVNVSYYAASGDLVAELEADRRELRVFHVNDIDQWEMR